MWFFIKRMFTLIITLLLISILTFYLFTFLPGDAALSKLGNQASPERVRALREEMGLDRPIMERYLNWLSDAFRGDFGESYQYRGNTVSSLLKNRVPVTITLTALSFLMLVAISIPLGILTAKYANTWMDGLIQSVTRITMAVPSFFLGILITYLFGLVLKWFQPGNFVAPRESLFRSIQYLFFPALAISLPKAAMVVRFLRTSILDEVNKDYVRTAYAKGNSKNRVFYRHILRNAMIPVITYLALLIVEILAGSVVVEQVFSVPGLGKLLVGAISNRDYPVVQAIVIGITAVVVALNFIVDVTYHFLDPRVELDI